MSAMRVPVPVELLVTYLHPLPHPTRIATAAFPSAPRAWFVAVADERPGDGDLNSFGDSVCWEDERSGFTAE